MKSKIKVKIIKDDLASGLKKDQEKVLSANVANHLVSNNIAKILEENVTQESVKKIKVEILADDKVSGLEKGQIKNLSINIANALIESKKAKLFKEKTKNKEV